MQVPKNLGCLVKMLFGFAVLILMGYFALMAMSPKARKWATSKQGPTPFKSLNQILAIPAQTIGKTKDVVVANDARVGVLDKVIAEEEGKKSQGSSAAATVADPFINARPAAGASSPGQPAPAAGTEPQAVSREAILAMSEKLSKTPDQPAEANPPLPARVVPKVDEQPAAPAQVKLPGGIVITNASPAGAPAASAPFLFWVVNLNISGVFNNNPHRILMKSRLVYEGEEVNRSLGIVFDHLDSEKKLLVFRDKTGALVTRSY